VRDRARLAGGGALLALLLLGLLAGAASPGFPVAALPAAVGRAVAGALGGGPGTPAVADDLAGGPDIGASEAALADVPSRYLALYVTAAEACPALTWQVLAAIGKVESDHGRARLPGVRSGWNRAGAAGPMQFGIGVGRAGNAWARFGRDDDHDGHTSVYDPGDAIPAAACYLCDAGAPHRLDAALYAYNPSSSYVALVKRWAAHYRGDGRR